MKGTRCEGCVYYDEQQTEQPAVDALILLILNALTQPRKAVRGDGKIY